MVSLMTGTILLCITEDSKNESQLLPVPVRLEGIFRALNIDYYSQFLMRHGTLIRYWNNCGGFLNRLPE